MCQEHTSADRHRLNQNETLGKRRNGRPKARWANKFRRARGLKSGHEQSKTGHSGVDTQDIRRHKQKVATPVRLVTQVPTYQTE